MKERLDKLLTVKSIVTFMLTVVFCILSVKGVINGPEFLTVFTMVMGFYFGTQSAKKTTTTTDDVKNNTTTEGTEA